MVLVLNFGHLLCENQLAHLTELIDMPIFKVIHQPMQLDIQQPHSAQVVALLDNCELSKEEWTHEVILMIPPGYSAAALILVAELAGRVGYLTPFVHLAPVPGAATANWDVEEGVYLQAVRDAARYRKLRSG